MFRVVKLSSVVVDKMGKARLVGFGTARTFLPDSKSTQIGTEGYSAPESYKGDSSPLSDMYSLASTLHHMFTRTDPRLEPPFTFLDRPISEHISEGGIQIEVAINKALQMSPSKRYTSMAEMKDELERIYYNEFTVSSFPLTVSTRLYPFQVA